MKMLREALINRKNINNVKPSININNLTDKYYIFVPNNDIKFFEHFMSQNFKFAKYLTPNIDTKKFVYVSLGERLQGYLKYLSDNKIHQIVDIYKLKKELNTRIDCEKYFRKIKEGELEKSYIGKIIT